MAGPNSTNNLNDKLKNKATGRTDANNNSALVAKDDMFKNFLEKHRKDFELVVPKSISADRLMRLAISACSRTPKLMECSLPTVFGGLLQAMALGFEVNSPMRQASLIPFKNNKTKQTEAQLIIEYRGMIQLFNNHEKVITVFAQEVYENDTFSYSYGSDEKLHHIPCETGNPGKIKGFYAYARLKDGGFRFLYWPTHKVNKIRDEYSTGYANNPEESPWNKDYAAMGCKTMIRQIEKFIPKSVEASKAVEADYQVVDFESPADRNNINFTSQV